MSKLITLNDQTKNITQKLSERADELLKYRISKLNGVEKESSKVLDHSVLLSAEYQGADQPTQLDSQKGFTELGELTTDIMSTVFNQVMSMAKEDNIFLKYISGGFSNSQKVFVTINQAQAGIAAGGTYGGATATTKVSGRNKAAYQTGFWSSKASLGIEELTLIRENGGIGGSYARQAMQKCIMQVVIELFQRQISMIPATIANNEYTYYGQAGSTDAVVVNYGRLTESNFVTDTEWMTINTTTNEVVYNLASNPIGYLLSLFSDENNTIIRNTIPFLKALVMNRATAVIFSKIALNNGSPISALAYYSTSSDPVDVIKAGVPALKDVDIYIEDSMVNTKIDPEFGTISGVIIPVIDYEQTGMGQMLYTPEPNGNFKSGSSAAPVGMLPMSTDESCYVRQLSSLSPGYQGDDIFWSFEGGGRFAFINPLAASTSWIIQVAAYTS